jgi:long-subunit fatty acid transport protein
MPTDKWQIEADAAWWDFSQARELGIDFSKANLTPAQTAVLTNPASNPTRFNPRNTMNVGAGVNYLSSDKLQTRAGFYYQAASLPERFFQAAFLDLPRYGATAGLGWKLTDSFSLDVAYNAIFFHGRAIDAPAPGGSGYKGKFNAFGNVASLGLTWRTGQTGEHH